MVEALSVEGNTFAHLREPSEEDLELQRNVRFVYFNKDTIEDFFSSIEFLDVLACTCPNPRNLYKIPFNSQFIDKRAMTNFNFLHKCNIYK